MVEVRRTVLDWLTAEGFAVKQEAQDGFEYVYLADLHEESGRTISVSQPRNKDKIVVSAGLSLSESDQNSVKASPGSGQGALRELSLALQSGPVLFSVEQENGVPSSVVLFENVYLDGLTKDRMMSAVYQVDKAQSLALLVFSGHLSNAGAAGEATPNPARTGERSSVPSGAVAVKTLAILICPKCGKQNLPRGKFCVSCGSLL